MPGKTKGHGAKIVFIMMRLPTPRLEIFPKHISGNASTVINLCHAHGAQIACVAKAVSAHPAVVRALASCGADMLADSRLSNLRAISALRLGLPLMLLRIPSPAAAAEVVRLAAYSLNSSVETMHALSKAARAIGVQHRVIVMLDLGDLREGVWPDRALDVVNQVSRLPNLEIAGLGSNLACFGGVLPDADNMQTLVDVRDACRQLTGLELNVLSGGNSVNLPLLAAGDMPSEINQLRIGETILLGCSVIDRSPWPGTRQDAFRVVAEVIELERKPSVPIGQRGPDAFGGFTEFVERGIRKRAICNIGRQDVLVDGIQPEDPGIIVLGGSSDHLVLDVQDAQSELQLGSEIAFSPNYGALLAASTSPYVEKVVMEG